MSASPGFCDHLRDLLRGFGPVQIRRMFGAAGVFRDGLMFAIVDDDILYFRADERNRPEFERAGMAQLTYESGARTIALPYFAAPPETTENAEEACRFARAAFAAAQRVRAAKPRPATAKPRPRPAASRASSKKPPKPRAARGKRRRAP